jgi:TRAP-type mannitol/chloroaromatic compound transport system substrate-binding protein
MKIRKSLIISSIFFSLLFITFSGCEQKVIEKKVIVEKIVEKKAKVYTWRLAMSWPTHLTPLASPPLKMAKMVKEMSNGRLIIKIDGSEKHKSALGVFDMVKAGQYQMAHSGSYYWKGKDINTLFFTSMPFGMNSLEQTSWFYYGGGLELMQEVYAKHGMYSFPGGNTGVQMGGWFRKEINTVDDLKGLKMRIPGFAGEIMADLGVTVVNMPGGELAMALERGTLDALEWVGPGMDIKMGFHKVAPYYYTGWHEPASEMQYMVNKKAFDKLPKDLQAILTIAMKATAADMISENYLASSDAWVKMKKDYPNIKVKHFPLQVLKAMKASNDKLIAKLEAKGGMTKKIIESQKAFLKKSREWTKISEYSYIKSMNELEK